MKVKVERSELIRIRGAREIYPDEKKDEKESGLIRIRGTPSKNERFMLLRSCISQETNM